MASFLQTREWGDFKAKYGWQAHWNDQTLVLSRRILLGKSLWYAPETELTDEDKIRALLGGIRPEAQADDAFVFRLEIAVPFSSELAQMLKRLKFRKSFESVQPEWRAVVNLRPSEEQILVNMHQKGRYNIRVAEKHGVTVSETEDIDQFYALYRETAGREKFSPRAKQYYIDFLALVPGATLFVAKKGSRPLAAAIVVFHQHSASYLYGASSNEERQLMAPYLLHWEVMREAKNRGAQAYDLGEIPPTDAPNHPLHGLGEFKMKFGADAVQLMGSWDYIYQPFWYMVFRVGEKMRRGFRA